MEVIHLRLSAQEALDAYWKSICLAAYQICCNIQDAEDAAADAFVKYCSTEKQFESRDHLRIWLFRVAINRARDISGSFWRKKNAELEEGTSFDSEKLIRETILLSPSAEEELLKKERSSALTKAVEALPEAYRIVIHLYYYDEVSCRDISKVLGLSEAAVRKRLCRGRNLLKEILKEDFSDD